MFWQYALLTKDGSAHVPEMVSASRSRPSAKDEERSQQVRFVLTFAVIIVGWAGLHDSYLMHVEPRHFTEYHRHVLPISNLWVLAWQYAVLATLGPGLAFGFLAHAACCRGRGRPVELRWVALGFVVIMVAVEIALIVTGHYSLTRFQAGLEPLYPRSLYPDLTDGIVFTQTVNVSAYLLAPLSGAIYLAAVWRRRRRRA